MGSIMLATSAGGDARVLHIDALRRAEASGSNLTVVHVIGGADYHAQPDQLREAIRSETHWLIHTLLGIAADRAGIEPVSVTIHILEGDVAEELIEFATSTRPDVVLVGAPRASGHSEFSTESFADLIAQLNQADLATEQIETA